MIEFFVITAQNSNLTMWNINWYGDAYDFGSSRLWFKVTSSHIFNRKSTSSRLL